MIIHDKVMTSNDTNVKYWKLERVVRKKARKHPSVIASRSFQICYRSANFLKVDFILPL